MKKYRLYDVYEEKEFLGEFDTMKEVNAACKERTLDTDGEWYAALYKYNREDGKYHICPNLTTRNCIV